MSIQEEEWVEFEVWLTNGIKRGWISAPVCATHDGLPLTQEEEDEFEEGFDPCAPGVRLWIR